MHSVKYNIPCTVQYTVLIKYTVLSTKKRVKNNEQYTVQYTVYIVQDNIQCTVHYAV